ncbi:energy-coupling factor ABC transporter permease [Catenuloplanes sp. NPDC051500]|uniref:energy-coupling factor ABC transporter permease n=1 Tax=Catenuloplanes sp. NPDC051500 TaxID=3363959 RepID=UPI00378B9F6A
MNPEALHISNGVLNGPVSIAYAVLAAVAIGVCVVNSRRDLEDRLVPMAGLVAAFIFAVQMLNFQVLPGVSGHLLGGALAAILVGPWVGALCMTIVITAQALFFADGGITALGPNITNMGLLSTAVGFGVTALLLRVLPRTPNGLSISVFVAAVVSVVVASQSFVLQYAIGGSTPLDERSLAGIAAVMGGTHLLIGIGEGLISAATVATVARVRPDLVYALRGLKKREVAV